MSGHSLRSGGNAAGVRGSTFSPGRVVGAALQQKSVATLGPLLHDHDGRDRVGELLAGELRRGQFVDGGAQVAGRVLLAKGETEFGGLGGGAAAGVERGDSGKVVGQCGGGGLLRRERALVDAYAGDLALPAQSASRADAEGLLAFDGPDALVEEHLQGLLDAIHIHMDAGRAHAAVVSDQHVAPLVERERVARLDAHAEIGPAKDDVEAQLTFDQVQGMPRSFEVIVGAGEDRAVGGFRAYAGGEGEWVAVIEARDILARGDEVFALEASRLLIAEGLPGGHRPVPRGPAFPFALGGGGRGFEGVQVVAQPADLAVELVQALLLAGKGRLYVGWLVAEVIDEAALGDVIEVSEELVELFLGEGIVLMIVAAGAPKGKSEPHGGGGLGAVGYVVEAELLVHDAALGAGAMVAVEGGGHLLRDRRAREQVAGDLLDGEAVQTACCR